MRIHDILDQGNCHGMLIMFPLKVYWRKFQMSWQIWNVKKSNPPILHCTPSNYLSVFIQTFWANL